MPSLLNAQKSEELVRERIKSFFVRSTFEAPAALHFLLEKRQMPDAAQGVQNLESAIASVHPFLDVISVLIKPKDKDEMPDYFGSEKLNMYAFELVHPIYEAWRKRKGLKEPQFLMTDLTKFVEESISSIKKVVNNARNPSNPATDDDLERAKYWIQGISALYEPGKRPFEDIPPISRSEILNQLLKDAIAKKNESRAAK